MENENLLYAWMWMMAVALGIAVGASMPPRRPLRVWLGDLAVRTGLAGLFLWFTTTGVWAIRELLNAKLVLPFSPLEAYVEYLTWWGAALTGMLTFTVFGAALFISAIFSRPDVIAITTAEAEAKAPVSMPNKTPQVIAITRGKRQVQVRPRPVAVVVDNRRRKKSF